MDDLKKEEAWSTVTLHAYWVPVYSTRRHRVWPGEDGIAESTLPYASINYKRLCLLGPLAVQIVLRRIKVRWLPVFRSRMNPISAG